MPEDNEIPVDVAGQIGGPSPEEQAKVDAEQRALMEQLAEERRPFEEAEREALQKKIDRAIEAHAEQRSLFERMKLLEARVTVLEARK